jgi:hypothetical protein
MALISLTEADRLLILLEKFMKNYHGAQLFSQSEFSGLKFLPGELATVPGGGGERVEQLGVGGAEPRNLHPSVWSGGHTPVLPTPAIDQYLTWHRE